MSRTRQSNDQPAAVEHPPGARLLPGLRLPTALLLSALLVGAAAPAAAAEDEEAHDDPRAVQLADEGDGDEDDRDEDDEEDRAAEEALAGVRDVVVTVVPPATPQQVAADYGLTLVATLPASADTHLLRAPQGTDVVALSAQLSGDARISLAEPDYATASPEGSGIHAWGRGPITGAHPALWQGQDALQRIGVPQAHRTSRGAGVTVAVLDSGVQLDHPALAPALLPGLDLVDGDTTPDDVGNGIDEDGDGIVDEGHGHGTHVAGLVRAVAPDARILPVRVLDTESRSSVFTVSSGIQRAIAAGADVVNLSLGTAADSDLFDEVLEEAAEDVVVVAASGNDGNTVRQYPAASGGVLAVASVDASDRRSVFSTYGRWIDVAAPGDPLVSTWIGGGYATWAGTSMAAPLVAGQAALLVRPGGEDAGQRVSRLVRSTAVALDPALGLGAGRIDVAASVAAR